MYFGNEAILQNAKKSYPDTLLVYEFNLSESIDIIKRKIKKAILSFIDKVNKFLDKCKDSKVKTICKNILSKVKNLLTKSDNIKDKKDVKEVSEELNQYNEEFKKYYEVSDEFKKDVENNDLLGIRLLIKDSLLWDNSFDAADKMIKYAQSKGVNPFITEDGNYWSDEKPQNEWDKDYMNLKLVEIVNNFTEEHFNYLKRIIKYIYKDD